MRFDKPEILVERGGNFVEEVGRHLIIEIISGLDRLARGLGGCCQGSSKRFEVLRARSIAVSGASI